eukprot:3701260-Amphidinium_carterae.1
MAIFTYFNFGNLGTLGGRGLHNARIDVPEEHGPAMILGEVFLRYYHSTFDRGALGSYKQTPVPDARAHTHTQHTFECYQSSDDKRQNKNDQNKKT